MRANQSYAEKKAGHVDLPTANGVKPLAQQEI